MKKFILLSIIVRLKTACIAAQDNEAYSYTNHGHRYYDNKMNEKLIRVEEIIGSDGIQLIQAGNIFQTNLPNGIRIVKNKKEKITEFFYPCKTKKITITPTESITELLNWNGYQRIVESRENKNLESIRHGI